MANPKVILNPDDAFERPMSCHESRVLVEQRAFEARVVAEHEPSPDRVRIAMLAKRLAELEALLMDTRLWIGHVAERVPV